MKKVLALILALIMICSTAAMLVYAEDATTPTDWEAVTAELGLQVKVPLAETAPVLDGVVNAGEYTKKVVNATDTIYNYAGGEIQSEVTEYFSHDADYVYYAVEFVQANDGRAFMWQFKPFNTFDIFNDNTDVDTYYYTRISCQARYNPSYVPEEGDPNVDYCGSWGPAWSSSKRVPTIYTTNSTENPDELYCAAGKVAETNVKTYEVRVAKSYLAEVNGCTAADIKVLSYFTYFHASACVGHVWTEADAAALTAAGAGFVPPVGEAGYKFIVLGDETLEELYKETTKDMGLHVNVPYAEVSPVVDGTINEGEYPASKVWTAEQVKSANAAVVDEGVTEFFAHDDEFIYYAIQMKQTPDNKAFQWQFRPQNSFQIYNAKEPDIDTTLFQRISWQIRMVSYEGEDLWCDGTGSWAPKWNYSGGDWRLPVYNEDLFYAGSKNVDTKIVSYEVKLAKAYVAELNECEAADVNVISYFTSLHGPQLSPTHTAEGNKPLLDLGATRADAGELFFFMVLQPSIEEIVYDMDIVVNVPYTGVSPVLDGAIGENEYPASKVWTPEQIVGYDETLVGDGVTEYFAHDDDFIYYAAEFTQTAANKAFQWQFKPHNSFNIFNAKEPDIDTTLFQRISWQMRMVSYEGEDLWCDATGSWAPAWNYSGGDWRLPVYNEDLFYAGSKNVETNKVVYEIKLAKAYVAELNECEVADVNVISYFTYFHSASFLGHTYTAEESAKLLEAGATRADTGNLFVFMVLEGHTHEYDEGVVTTEPTHTAEGVKTFTCECGKTYTEAVAKTTEHNWGEGVVTTEPTVDAEGVKTFTCECGETKTEAIAKLDPPPADDNDDTTTTTTTTAATTTAAPAAKKGCKGSIAISALVIAPVLAGGAMLLKKKED